MTIPRPGRIVVDASVVVALLADVGPAGEWAAAQVSGPRLFAPDLMPYEASNILRRHVLAGLLDASAATLAHSDLTALAFELCPYRMLAQRVWALCDDVTACDSAYVALAELLAAPLLTLDARLARATGPRCDIVAYQQPASA